MITLTRRRTHAWLLVTCMYEARRKKYKKLRYNISCRHSRSQRGQGALARRQWSVDCFGGDGTGNKGAQPTPMAGAMMAGRQQSTPRTSASDWHDRCNARLCNRKQIRSLLTIRPNSRAWQIWWFWWLNGSVGHRRATVRQRTASIDHSILLSGVWSGVQCNARSKYGHFYGLCD